MDEWMDVCVCVCVYTCTQNATNINIYCTNIHGNILSYLFFLAFSFAAEVDAKSSIKGKLYRKVGKTYVGIYLLLVFQLGIMIAESNYNYIL